MTLLERSSIKRPVIASLASAQREFKAWLDKQWPQELFDKNGVAFRLKITPHQAPHPVVPHTTVYSVQMTLSSPINQKILLDSGTCDEVRDARILQMLGDRHFVLSIPVPLLEDLQWEKLRQRTSDQVQRLQKWLLHKDLNPLRKKILGESIDRQCLFGHEFFAIEPDTNALDV